MVYLLALLSLLLSVQEVTEVDNPVTVKLKQELLQTHDQKKKIALLNELSKHNWEIAPAKAVAYGKEAAKLAKDTGDKKGLGLAYNNIGVGYYWQSKYTLATEYAYKGLKEREDAKDTAGIASSYNTLGNMHSKINNFDKALFNFNKTLMLAEAVEDYALVASALNNIGSIYEEQNLPDKAIAYYKQAYALQKKVGNKQYEVIFLINIGYQYNLKKEYKTALDYFSRAMKINQENKNDIDKVYILNGMAESYFKMKNNTLALSKAEECLVLAKRISFTKGVLDVAPLLEQISIALNDYNSAYQYLDLHTQYQDTLYSQEKERQLAEMHVKYETEEKDIENKRLLAEKKLQAKELEQKAYVQYVAGGLLLLAAFLALVFFRGRQRVKSINHLLFERSLEISRQNQRLGEQKAAVESLSQIKDRLFSIVSHDLRGPMASLKSMLYLLKKNALSEDKVKYYAGHLKDEQQKILWLLDNLLIWAKSQMDGWEIKPERIKLYDLVQETYNLLDLQAQGKCIVFENLISEDAEAYADGEMIKLVLRNLVSNAVKFCKEGDVVSAFSYQEKNQVVLAIQDTGCGIKEEDKSRLFAFDGYTTVGTGNEKGTGLGLSLCRDALEKNGGSIWAESILGEGSTFFFSLPVKEKEEDIYAEEKAVEVALWEKHTTLPLLHT